LLAALGAYPRRAAWDCLCSRSGGDFRDAHLLEQRQVVFDVPIVGDPAVLDLHEIGGDEVDRLALALRLAERAGEMSGESGAGEGGVSTRGSVAPSTLGG